MRTLSLYSSVVLPALSYSRLHQRRGSSLNYGAPYQAQNQYPYLLLRPQEVGQP